MAQEYLSERERELVQKISGNPLELMAGELKAWMEEFVRVMLPTGAGGSGGWVVGDTKIIQKDLTAQTTAYVYEDDSGQWLYCNGAQVSKTTYASLYAFYGANAFGADTANDFFLPDARGRSIFLCGTSASTDLGDNDGVALSSRTPNHSHSSSFGITGSPGVGSLAVSPNPHSHTVTAVPSVSANTAGGTGNWPNTETLITTSSTSLSITGSPSVGTLGVSGSVGSGVPVDSPAHLVVGSLLVRFS